MKSETCWAYKCKETGESISDVASATKVPSKTLMSLNVARYFCITKKLLTINTKLYGGYIVLLPLRYQPDKEEESEKIPGEKKKRKADAAGQSAESNKRQRVWILRRIVAI